jgi:peptide deformylase
MILPIRLYGDPVLRAEAAPVEENTAEVQSLIDDMIETMYGAAGIGLAAPQVGFPLRLFVIDLTPVQETGEEAASALPEEIAGGPHVFINPEITDEAGNNERYEEGCLSIPNIREEVTRPDAIRVRYLDRNFEQHELLAEGMLARVIQHELDHLDGVLFVDRISSFRKRLLRRKLREIARGEVDTEYPVTTDKAKTVTRSHLPGAERTSPAGRKSVDM